MRLEKGKEGIKMTLKVQRFSVTASLVLIFLFVICSVNMTAAQQKKTASEDEQKATNLIGRYQIIPVEYERSDDGNRSKVKAVLKIDTQSGKTWFLSESYGKSNEGVTNIIQGWFELKDNPDLLITDKTGAVIKRVPMTTK